MADKVTRILLADDHALVRAGIKALLDKIPGIEVVAEAGSGSEALDLVKIHMPDVVLLDIAMPGISGLEVLQQIKTAFPSIRVIILTIHDNPAYAVGALRSGADGYLPKKAAS